MHLVNLTIRNWGVFRGAHEFNLEPMRRPDRSDMKYPPDISYPPRRHVTVISGHNGAGKSTLFQALALALHGALALGDRVSRQAYADFLLNRLHRRSGGDTPVIADGIHPSDEGSVALSFRYVQSGRPSLIQVERSWRRHDHADGIHPSVLETLIVRQDGSAPDVDPADYQTWLNDLVPPGIAALCFFDAEQLSALTGPERHNGALGSALNRLLGLDLVERLQADLEYYTLRRGGGQQVERLREKVIQYQTDLDALGAQLNQRRAEAEALAAGRADLEAELAQQEYRLAAEGGSYAARRPELQRRLTAVQSEIESVSEQLRELSAGLLPFALAPELCQALSQRLAQEADLHRQRVAAAYWQEQVERVESSLQNGDLWQGLDVSGDARQVLARRLAGMLREPGPFYAAGHQLPVHHLAQPEQAQVQEWIAQALHVVPQQAQVLGRQLRGLRDEQNRIEADLRRTPDDEALAPIHAEIVRLEAAVADVHLQQKSLDEQIGALQFQRDEQARRLRQASEQLAAAQSAERQLALAQRSRLALRAYQDALTRQRLAALEDALVTTFNVLCRKEQLLAAVAINPDDFHVQLQSSDGHLLGLGDLSAGEQQLYGLALLWALRRVSGWLLPLVADTPLARLDEVHRRRLIHDYIPAVSDQVVLFATGAELDDELMGQAEPYLARVYRLDYSPASEETVVTYDRGG